MKLVATQMDLVSDFDEDDSVMKVIKKQLDEHRANLAIELQKVSKGS